MLSTNEYDCLCIRFDGKRTTGGRAPDVASFKTKQRLNLFPTSNIQHLECVEIARHGTCTRLLATENNNIISLRQFPFLLDPRFNTHLHTYPTSFLRIVTLSFCIILYRFVSFYIVLYRSGLLLIM